MSRDGPLLDDLVARLWMVRERLGPAVYRAAVRTALHAIAVAVLELGDLAHTSESPKSPVAVGARPFILILVVQFRSCGPTPCPLVADRLVAKTPAPSLPGIVETL
ncbi:hypothetical+protein [Methylocapsa aurea]